MFVFVLVWDGMQSTGDLLRDLIVCRVRALALGLYIYWGCRVTS